MAENNAIGPQFDSAKAQSKFGVLNLGGTTEYLRIQQDPASGQHSYGLYDFNTGKWVNLPAIATLINEKNFRPLTAQEISYKMGAEVMKRARATDTSLSSAPMPTAEAE